MSILFKRKKWDRQPTGAAAVLLASDGRAAFGSAALARARALAGGDPVALVTIARIHGTGLGLPAPGLRPTSDEMNERLGWLRQAIGQLERDGMSVDGQIAQTRRPARTICRVARVRGVRVVVIEQRQQSRTRRLIEGDVATDVARALRRRGIDVEIVAGVTEAETISSAP